MLFQEALEHVPDNAVVIEIAPHSLLQAVLRRALPDTCAIVGLMDKRQPDNLVHILTSLGKYVFCAVAVVYYVISSVFFACIYCGDDGEWLCQSVSILHGVRFRSAIWFRSAINYT